MHIALTQERRFHFGFFVFNFFVLKTILANPQYNQAFGFCTTPNGEIGECVPLRQCSPLINILTRSTVSSVEELHVKRSLCGYIPRSPLVCCPKSAPELANHTTSTTKAEKSKPESPIRFDLEPTSSSRLITVSELPQPGECGTIDEVISGLIVGGKQADVYDSPWMALLQYKKPNNSTGFHCAGALISSEYVLTASHCVRGKDLTAFDWKIISVRLGEWDLSRTEDCKDGVCSDGVIDVPVQEIIPHQLYRSHSVRQEHDIALIRLKRPVEFNRFVRPICLPIDRKIRGRSYTGVTMSVAGWGFTSTDEDASSSNVKLKVSMNGVSLKQCNQMYRKYRLTLTSNQICAGGVEGVDSCKGDSGSPLTRFDSLADPPHSYAVGIVSFGLSRCGQADWPGVYTRVDAYIDWILSKMRVDN